jgi:hypothetical protein
MHGWRIGWVIAALSSFATPCFAQTAAEVAARRDLVTAATQARDAGQHEQALDLAMRASRIEMTTSLRLFIAEEQEASGRFAAAIGNADVCARDARDNPHLNNRETILGLCSAIGDRLRPRIGHVVIHLASPAPPGAHVRVNGEDVNEAFLGVPYAVDPGTVTVEVSNGGATSRREFQVGSGATESVDVVVPAAAVAASVGPQPTRASTTSFPWVGPLVLLGASAVSFGFSAGFFVARQNALSSCTPVMGESAVVCTSNDAMAAPSWNTLTNVGLVAGSVFAAGAIVWWTVGFVSRRESRRPVAFVAGLPDGAMAVVAGRF